MARFVDVDGSGVVRTLSRTAQPETFWTWIGRLGGAGWRVIQLDGPAAAPHGACLQRRASEGVPVEDVLESPAFEIGPGGRAVRQG